MSSATFNENKSSAFQSKSEKWLRTKSIWLVMLTEFIGTFLLVTIIITPDALLFAKRDFFEIFWTTNVVHSNMWMYFWQNLWSAVGIYGCIQICGRVSAHFNPVFSFVFYSRVQTSQKPEFAGRMVAKIAMQFIGSFLACLIFYRISSHTSMDSIVDGASGSLWENGAGLSQIQNQNPNVEAFFTVSMSLWWDSGISYSATTVNQFQDATAIMEVASQLDPSTQIDFNDQTAAQFINAYESSLLLVAAEPTNNVKFSIMTLIIFGVEFVATFALLWCVYGFEKNFSLQKFWLILASFILLITWVGAMSEVSLNPARLMGPAIIGTIFGHGTSFSLIYTMVVFLSAEIFAAILYAGISNMTSKKHGVLIRELKWF